MLCLDRIMDPSVSLSVFSQSDIRSDWWLHGFAHDGIHRRCLDGESSLISCTNPFNLICTGVSIPSSPRLCLFCSTHGQSSLWAGKNKHNLGDNGMDSMDTPEHTDRLIRFWIDDKDSRSISSSPINKLPSQNEGHHVTHYKQKRICKSKPRVHFSYAGKSPLWHVLLG